MRDHEVEFSRHNIKVVIITFENDYFARLYAAETSLSWPLLIDENRETYKGYGMQAASFWNVWGPRSWSAYLPLILKGRTLKQPTNDIYQQGGDVLIDPSGIVRLHHISKGPADRPTVEMILRIIGV